MPYYFTTGFTYSILISKSVIYILLSPLTTILPTFTETIFNNALKEEINRLCEVRDVLINLTVVTITQCTLNYHIVLSSKTKHHSLKKENTEEKNHSLNWYGFYVSIIRQQSGGKTIILYVRSAWQQKWNANTINHHDVSQIGFCQGFLRFRLGSFKTKFKELLVNIYEVRWPFAFLKIDLLQRITLLNAIHQTTSIYVCGCVCVCVKTKKLTWVCK